MGAYQPLQQHHHGQRPSTPNPGGAAGYFLPRTVVTWLAVACLSLALLHLLCCYPPGRHQAVFSPLLQYFSGTYSSYFSSGVARGGGGGVEERSSCKYSEGRWAWAPGHARRYNGVQRQAGAGLHPQRAPRYGVPGLAVAAGRLRAPGVRRGSFPRRGAGQARGVRRRIDGAEPGGVTPLPPRRRVPVLPRGPGRRALQAAVHAVGVPVARGDAVHLLGTVPRQVRGQAAQLQHGVQPRLPRPRQVMGRRRGDDGRGGPHRRSLVLEPGRVPQGRRSGRRARPPGAQPHRDRLHLAAPGVVPEGAGAARLRRAAADRGAGHLRAAALRGKPIFDPTACTRTGPYKEGEKELGSIEREMRSIVFEEAAAAPARDGGKGAMRVEVQDVTRLASMRPDGHPGPYMHRDPFAHGVPERMQTDCLHSFLPGPLDNFNEILLQILSRPR